MKKSFVTIAALCLASMLSAKAPDWITIPATQAKDSEAKLVCSSPEAFDLTITAKKDCKNAGLQIVRTYHYKVHKNTEKIRFKARSVNGKPIVFNLVFTVQKDGKIISCWGPKTVISGKEFRTYEYSVSKAFGVKDAEFKLWQFKPGIGFANGKAGESVTLEVRDFVFGPDDGTAAKK